MTARHATLLLLLLWVTAPASLTPGATGDQLLGGATLVLRDAPGRAKRRALTLVSRHAAVTLGAGNGSADDPVVHGGSLRVLGSGFDTTYDLAPARWRYVGGAGRGRGYLFAGDGVVRSVRVKPGKAVRVVAKGPRLGHTLVGHPGTVDVVLTLGGARYCFTFGGAVDFRAGTRFEAVGAPAALACPANLATWPMHPIDSRFRGSNALGRGDVNGDGFADYVSNYEFDQRYVIAFHPGADGNVRAPWPTVIAYQPPVIEAGRQFDSESAALADLDGDGHLDIVASQGGHFSTFWEGRAPGIRVIWGPPAAEATDPAAWLDAGRIPDTIDGGHFLWQLVRDLNGDGAPDILGGGRVLFDNGRKAGVFWIEAPAALADRRDLSRWRLHYIDAEQFDGHGFVLADVDEDGDPDLVDANADFDTPEDQETVHWYENPGPGTAAQRDPWPYHEIYRGSEFDPKPQIAVADLDGDGAEDILTATAHDIYWFRKTGIAPVTWQRVAIPKDPMAQWFQRPLRVADVNGDGRLDLFGMLSHDDGVLPVDKASAFWMEYRGAAPGADNWTTHPIKWSAGTVMQIAAFGEKWDQVDLTDVDGDGDLDVVANCEEWWTDDDGAELMLYFDPRVNPIAVSVVWFENRLRAAAPVCTETRRSCVLEAERYTDLEDGTWVIRAGYAGYAGDGYVQALNKLPPPNSDGLAWSETRGARYAINVRGGSYTLWLRRWAPARFDLGLGGAKSNAVWVGVDGADGIAVGDDDESVDSWTWVRAAAPLTLTPGAHTLTVRVKERGYALDRLLLTRAAGFRPSGTGPVATGP